MKTKIALALATLLGSTLTAALGSLITHYYTKHTEVAEYLSQYSCAIQPEIANLRSALRRASVKPSSYSLRIPIPLLEAVAFETKEMPIELRTKLLRIQNQKTQLDITSIDVASHFTPESKKVALNEVAQRALSLDKELQTLESEIRSHCKRN